MKSAYSSLTLTLVFCLGVFTCLGQGLVRSPSGVNDSLLLLKLEPSQGLFLIGETKLKNVRLSLLNGTSNGHEYSLISTGNGAQTGAGQFLLLDATAGSPRLLIDSSGSAGFNTEHVASGVGVDMSKAPGALLLPKLTTTEINALPNPQNGMLMYDKDLNQFVAWNDTMMYLGLWQRDGNHMYINDTFLNVKVGIGTSTPVTKLQVAGNLTVDGLSNTEGKMLGTDANGKLELFNDTIYLSISPLEFESSSEVTTTFTSEGFAASIEGGAGTLWALLRMPGNAWNDTMLLTFIDGAAANLTFSLMRMAYDGSGFNELATHTTTGSIPGVLRTVKLPLNGTGKNDPGKYAYYLKVTSGAWGAGLAVGSCYWRGRRNY